MYPKSFALRFLSAIGLIVILASCSSPTATPTPAPTNVPQPTVNLQPTINAAQTMAVQTFAADLTKNAPTATRIVPTNTLVPTLAATITPAKPASTATATQKPQPVGPTATTAVFCSVISVTPTEATTLTPGESFNAVFVVVNTGATTWTASEFGVAYWSGTRFVGQQRVNVPFDTDQGSNITIATGSMTAPSGAGTYRSVWAITKGAQPYCLIPVTVVVK
jgi:hypothetical protein